LLYVEQLSVAFNGVNALQNWKDPQNTMYTFSLRAHHLTCEMVSSACFYVVSHTCSINMQIPIVDFHAFCVVPVGRICLDIKLIFLLLFNSFKTILSTCTPVFCVVLWGENGCFSEIKIKKLLIIKCSSMSEECWIIESTTDIPLSCMKMLTGSQYTQMYVKTFALWWPGHILGFHISCDIGHNVRVQRNEI